LFLTLRWGRFDDRSLDSGDAAIAKLKASESAAHDKDFGASYQHRFLKLRTRMDVSSAEAEKLLQQAFQNFVTSIHLLRDHIARDSKDTVGTSLFGPLALETLAMWTMRIKYAPIHKNHFTSLTRAPSDNEYKQPPSWAVESVVAMGLDAFTSVLKVDKTAASSKIISAGAIQAVVHALQAGSLPYVSPAILPKRQKKSRDVLSLLLCFTSSYSTARPAVRRTSRLSARE